MPIHDLVFWLSSFFLIGVLLISIFNYLPAVIAVAVLFSLIFAVSKKYYFSVLALFIIIGAFYYQVFDSAQHKINIPFGSRSEVLGIIKSVDKKDASQNLIVDLASPYSGRIRIVTQSYLGFQYGDLIKSEGVIKEPPAESAVYLLKDGILGIESYPKINLVESGHGNFIKARLLNFRNRIIGIFKATLPTEKAALLSGITLGSRESFSRDLANKMSLTGTTHLVALSGYNISVIALAVGAIFSLYLSRSISFYLTVLAVVLFVLMTGAEASAVRAAIMGIIALFANEVQRSFSLRNAIVIAAFFMVLYNPKVLVFDLGFQLSFLALIGIVYLQPILKKIFKINGPGFLSWKNNFLTTLSAQTMVLPLLIGKFGVFSMTSFVSNILLLEVMPLTMALGFILAGLGFVSNFLARLFGLLVNLLLSYELWVIDLFSRLKILIAIKSLSPVYFLFYYLILIGVIVYYGRGKKQI